MSEQDYEQLTLFPADSPASRSLQPGSAEAVRMTVTSGQRCSELSKKSGPLGLLERTLLESSTWHSTRSYLTWKVKATKQGRLYFQLAVSTPRTAGTESQSWPTPTARDSKGANSIKHLTREGKRNHTDQLANAVKLWPTPTASDAGSGGSAKAWQEYTDKGKTTQCRLRNAVQMYATPQARDYRTGQAKRWGNPARSRNLNDQVAAMYPTPTTGASLCGGSHTYQRLKALKEAGEITEEERQSMAAGNGGQLNPDWVEAMMGFPPGWTASEPDGQTEPGKPESHE